MGGSALLEPNAAPYAPSNVPLFFRIEFTRWSEGRIETEIVAGSQVIQFVTEDSFYMRTPPDGAQAAFRQLLGSADSLREAMIAQSDGLRAIVTKGILEDKSLTKCVGDGSAQRARRARSGVVSDYEPCRPRRQLTKKERAEEIALVESRAAAETQLIQTSYRDLWGALDALVPGAKCRELLVR